MKQRLERWLGNILYKRVRQSHSEILNNQIEKGAEKYADPLPGNWTAKQLIRHGKEENVDQFVYYEALEIVVENMETEIAILKDSLNDERQRRLKAEKVIKDQQVIHAREIRKWVNFGR